MTGGQGDTRQGGTGFGDTGKRSTSGPKKKFSGATLSSHTKKKQTVRIDGGSRKDFDRVLGGCHSGTKFDPLRSEGTGEIFTKNKKP